MSSAPLKRQVSRRLAGHITPGQRQPWAATQLSHEHVYFSSTEEPTKASCACVCGGGASAILMTWLVKQQVVIHGLTRVCAHACHVSVGCQLMLR